MFRLTKKWNALVQILVIVLVYVGIQAYHKRNSKSGMVPALYGTLLDGRTISPVSLTGRPYLVHFWATWCSICRLEQGSINAIAKDYSIITIATQSGSNEEVAKFASEQNLHFPILVDDSGHWAKIFGVQAYPTSYFVDSKGEIRFVEVGYTTELGLRSRLYLSE